MNFMSSNNFTIPGFNQMPIAASLYMPAVNMPPIVVYAHGISGFKDWGGMEYIARSFTDAGLAYLAINFSHNGTSPSEPDTFVNLDAYAQDSYLKRQYDLEQVVAHIENTLSTSVDANRIYLIGHSRGGTDAILYAAQDKRIKKLISWAAPCEAKTPWGNWDAAQMKAWQENKVDYRPNSRTQQQLPISIALYEEYKAHKAALNVETAARSLEHTPWLIVHGEADEAVFVKEAYDLKSWQPNARVLIIPEGDHTFGRVHPWPAGKDFPRETQILVEKSIAFLLGN
jgi:dienelactone hydrolase